jgi:hypothetical protein
MLKPKSNSTKTLKNPSSNPTQRLHSPPISSRILCLRYYEENITHLFKKNPDNNNNNIIIIITPLYYL